MCGICGVLTGRSPARPLPAAADDRTTVAPRPGRQRLLRRRRVGLGHTRLAIIDTAGGAQPLSNEDGTLWVTFNGEIFNYVELRRRAARAAATASGPRSDTEVIVHAWEEWGEDVLRRGSTASGRSRCGTATRRRLVLSRDRLGVRPLYYARSRRPAPLRLRGQGDLRRPGRCPRAFDPVGLDQIVHLLVARSPHAPSFAGIAAARARARRRPRHATGSAATPTGASTSRARGAEPRPGRRRRTPTRCASG